MTSPQAMPAPSATRWNLFFDRFVFFTWWVKSQQAVQEWPRATRRWLIAICATLGVAARLWAQALPGNWDFGQWINVSNAALSGQDPYALFGYNYPPPWLITLSAFNAVTQSTEAFRLAISILLIAVDLGIAWLLIKRGYALAACGFLLSPVVIAISGQHQQVEGIAVFLALAAMAVLGTSEQLKTRICGADWWAALLLGLSLSFKPVFLILPIWLFIRQGNWGPRFFRLLAPLVVFAVIFSSAFLVYPAGEIIQKVLKHSGANNSPLINAFVPQQVAPWVLVHGGGKIAFLVLLIAAGFLFRKLAPFEMALAYTVSAVVFSWAMVNQYLAGPMAAVAVFLNLGFLLWFLLSSIYLGGSEGVLNLPIVNQIQPHLFLDWEKVMQDLFPWMLIGWVIFAFATHRQARTYRPIQAVDQAVEEVRTR